MRPGRLGTRIAGTVARLLSRAATTGDRPSHPSRPDRPGPPGPSERLGAYPGDYTGPVHIQYSPHLDGDADPGEVVWGWIPYEDDHSQGKDRPALVIGRDRNWLLVLMLTSKDKNHSAGAEERHEVWVDVGSGPWDREHRPSEIRVDRVIRLADSAVRREGAILDRRRFDSVAETIRLTRNQ